MSFKAKHCDLNHYDKYLHYKSTLRDMILARKMTGFLLLLTQSKPYDEAKAHAQFISSALEISGSVIRCITSGALALKKHKQQPCKVEC